MELIRISKGKLKIALSKDELEAYSITAESIDFKNTETQTVFKELFVRAKEKTGFDTEEDKIFVQIYTVKDGGCEIFVTRIEPKNRKTVSDNKVSAFSTDNLSDIISLCKRLKSIGFIGKSDAYIKEESYILILHGATSMQYACALEFANHNDNFDDGYINERMTVLRKEDAVTVLSLL